MSRGTRLKIAIALALSLILPGATTSAHDRDSRRRPAGAVYAMTNAATNEIVVYDRARNGTLTFSETVATGGTGQALTPGDGMGANKPLILSKNRRWLFAVNAGSNEVSVFRVRRHELTLVDKVDSGGEFPVSLAHHKGLLYVLNSGGEGNITGFTVNKRGQLTPLGGSTRSLEAGGTNPPFFLASPAQIGFSRRGDQLVVTAKGSNEIHVFSVASDGLPSAQPATTLSNGFTPFGFTFGRRGRLLVVEAFGAATAAPPPPTPEAGAVSSYSTNPDGTLSVITGSLANSQTATCWIVTNRLKRFAYSTSNLSNTITGYRINRNGSLRLLDADGVTATTGGSPEDLEITRRGRFLYNVNAADGTIGMFSVNRRNGSLSSLGVVDGLPVNLGAAGIAVR